MVEITTVRVVEPSSNPGTSSTAATKNQEQTKSLNKVFSRRKGVSTLGKMGERSDSKRRTEEQFKVAHRQSDWFLGIENKDCKRLMELLAENPRLLLETGEEGRTVLHVASMQGCLRLVNQVMDIVPGEDTPGAEGIGVSRNDYLKAIDGRTTMTAFDLASLVIGNKDVALYLDDRPVERRIGVLYLDEKGNTSNDGELKSALQNVMQEVLEEDHDFEDLKRGFDEDVDYNFEVSGAGLIYIFHHAIVKCKAEFVARVTRKCEESKVGGLVDYLWRVEDWKGRSSSVLLLRQPFFSNDHNMGILALPKNVFEYVVDSMRWTPLHWAATFDRYVGMNKGSEWAIFHAGIIKHDHCPISFYFKLIGGHEDVVNARLSNYSFGATPLHLAIIHGNEYAVRVLVEQSKTDLNATIRARSVSIGGVQSEIDVLTLAVLVGNEGIVEILLRQAHRIFDIGKHKNLVDSIYANTLSISAFHVAAAKGNPNILRLFLDNREFDPLVVDGAGNTALHYATDASITRYDLLDQTQDRFNMYRIVEQIEYFIKVQKSMQHDGCNVDLGYSQKQGCINMLLQAGVDIWQKNYAQKLPDPGPTVKAEDRKWWHDKIERETFQVKTNLNGAGNSISVIAALIATASYVGPLQPPLGYGSNQYDATYDFVQATNLLVRVYVVANSLSFYFAIASIMFAVVPSLPMPQEGILEELERTRRAVALAIGVLLMSIIAIIISFAVASIMVVPEKYSWDHVGLTFYPAIVGGIFCFVGILLFFIRMLRLVFPKSKWVRKIYHKFVKI